MSKFVDEKTEEMETITPVLKYAKEIAAAEAAKSTPCVGSSYQELDMPSFRWTFKDITNSKNFIPRAMDTDNPRKDMDALDCDGWSLSFFSTETQAITKLKKYCNDKNKLYKKLGTHIAEGNISKTHGKCGDFGGAGHFEHFEYSGTDFTKTFTVKTEVFKW